MTLLRITTILLLLFCILCTTGCTELSGTDDQTGNTSNTSSPVSIAKYSQTLAQPEYSADMVEMDTDIYNIGEVVEFVITNKKTGELSCTNNPPAFSVRYQKGTGQWVIRMGGREPGTRQHYEPETRGIDQSVPVCYCRMGTRPVPDHYRLQGVPGNPAPCYLVSNAVRDILSCRNKPVSVYSGESGEQPVCGGTIRHHRDNEPRSR